MKAKIENILSRLTREFPDMAYCGKNYTIQDLINDLEEILPEENQDYVIMTTNSPHGDI